ncbi:unnamed protein product [Prorocentrum cordatum]|uniref:Uncharacterized protein n=1 Tax=Prorocentrum cordatum TaxID=2364126 RepID=A0ABN9WBR0_9DINO|nr:unnamed protein product [Polarella glacialis]
MPRRPRGGPRGLGARGAALLLLQALVARRAHGSRTRSEAKAKVAEQIAQPVFLLMSSPAEQKVSYTLLQDPEVPAAAILPLIDSGLGEPHGIAYDPIGSILYVADFAEEAILCYRIGVQKCARNDCTLEYELVVDSVQMHVAYSVKTSWVSLDHYGNLFYSDEAKKSINRIDIMLLRKIHAGLVTGEQLKHSHESQLAKAAGATPDQAKKVTITSEYLELMETSIVSLYEAGAGANIGTPAGVASDGVEVFWTNQEGGIVNGSVTGGLVEPQAISKTITVANVTANAYGIALTSTQVLFTDKENFVYIVSKSGGAVTALTSGLHSPRGLVWNGYYTSFVADSGSDAVFSFPTGDASENQPLQLIASFHDPFGIALIKATDPAFARLQARSAAGGAEATKGTCQKRKGQLEMLVSMVLCGRGWSIEFVVVLVVGGFAYGSVVGGYCFKSSLTAPAVQPAPAPASLQEAADTRPRECGDYPGEEVPPSGGMAARAAGQFHYFRYNVGAPAILHERLSLLPGYILTPDDEVYAESDSAGGDSRAVHDSAGHGDAIVGVAANKLYKFRRLPSAAVAWAAARSGVAQGHGPLAPSPFILELSADNVLGVAKGVLAVFDPLGAAPAAAAPGALALAGAAAPPAGAPGPPAASAATPVGGLGALAAALGAGGAALPAAAGPPGVGAAAAAPAAPGAAGSDPRVLATVLDARGVRDMPVRDAVKRQTETPRADWPVKGLTTTTRVLHFMFRMAGGATAWLNRWMAIKQASETDDTDRLHETLSRVVETSLCHDQLIICELSSYEFLSRQLLMVEERFFEERARRTHPAPKAKGQAKDGAAAAAADVSSELGHFFGTGETMGNLCIFPPVMDWIAEQMKSEAAVAKERRKVTIASVTFFRFLFFQWMGVAIFRLVAGLVCAPPKAASVDYIAGLHRDFELPAAYSERGRDCEASLVEMLAQAPGYAGDSGRVRPYSMPLVAWPESTKAVSTCGVVSEADSIVLQDWRQSMLNPESVAAELRDSPGVIRPYVDPELRFKPKSYAEFLKQLEAHGMITWRGSSEQASFSTGLFFVQKSNGKLRLVFDTRLANCSFSCQPATRLPTPSARASLDCDDSFYFAQGDIQCFFYHLRLPAGMESLFSLPPINNRFIGLKSVNGVRLGINDCVQPLVTVVPIGWSWALHLCQSALTRALSDVGFGRDGMSLDGGCPRPLVAEKDAVCAGYVDNFCVVSKCAETATSLARAVADLLTARGLPVLEFSPAVSKGVFTGLEIDGASGIIRVRPDRLARTRQAVLGLLKRGRASAGALSVLVGHCTWGVILRRDVLSIFNAVYRFMGAVGPHPGPLWPSVVRELSAAVALIPLWSASTRSAESPNAGDIVMGMPCLPDHMPLTSTVETMLPTEVIKAARARRGHPGPLTLLRGGLSVLEANAVSESTGKNYHASALRFLNWCLWTARDFKNSVELDTILVVFFVHLFLDGHDSATGRVTMASLKHHLPSMLMGSRPLPRAFRALQGWTKLVPPQMRLPLQRVAMFAIVGALLSQGLLSQAVFVRIAFDTYLRPSEAYHLTAASLIAPRSGATEGHQHWALLVNDAASGGPGKTGVTDESVIVDDPLPWPLLEALRQGRRAEESLWAFTPHQLRRAFAGALVQLGISDQQTSLYSPRHGGASDDLLSGRRTRKEVKDQSLNRYAKRARMQQRLGQLDPALVDFGQKVESDLLGLMDVMARAGIFSLPLPPLRPVSASAPVQAPPAMTDKWLFV